MTKDKVKPILEKPIEPTPPNPRDYPSKDDIKPWMTAFRGYEEKMKRYKEEVEIYEQTKLIKFIKNADIKLILKKYRITKVV